MGRGNNRLLAWDGSKTLTLTVEDALFSAIGLSILMGADIADTSEGSQEVHVRKGIKVKATEDKKLDLSPLVQLYQSGTDAGKAKQELCDSAPLYVIEMENEKDGSLTSTYVKNLTYTKATSTQDSSNVYHVTDGTAVLSGPNLKAGTTYYIDCYVKRPAEGVKEIQIRKDKFPGYFYVEAETLYRRLDTGADMPATLTFPKVKIQSNFSISMSSEGDPSVATFTIDCFPGYTYFDSTKEVLCVMQIIDDNDVVETEIKSVMLHKKGEDEEGVEILNHPTYIRTENEDKYGFSDSAKTNDGTGAKYDDPENI